MLKFLEWTSSKKVFIRKIKKNRTGTLGWNIWQNRKNLIQASPSFKIEFSSHWSIEASLADNLVILKITVTCRGLDCRVVVVSALQKVETVVLLSDRLYMLAIRAQCDWVHFSSKVHLSLLTYIESLNNRANRESSKMQAISQAPSVVRRPLGTYRNHASATIFIQKTPSNLGTGLLHFFRR